MGGSVVLPSEAGSADRQWRATSRRDGGFAEIIRLGFRGRLGMATASTLRA